MMSDEQNEQAAEKICTRCKNKYPATKEYFRKCALGKMGLSPECKDCLKLRWKTTPAETIKKYNANKKAALKKNPERLEAREKYRKDYVKERPEWLKDMKRRYYERHRLEVINKSREYRKNTPGYSVISHEKRAAKGSVRRARKFSAGGSFTKQDVIEKIEKQNKKCFYCKCELNTYHVDHYIPLAKGGSNAAENIVIACPSCNLRKSDLMPNVFMERLQNEKISIRA